MQRAFSPPGTRPRYAPDHACDVRHVKIALDIDVDARRISGRCSLTLAPIAAPLGWLPLDAVELDIERVSVGGRDVPHRHDGKVLRVNLGAEAAESGEAAEGGEAAEIILDIDYSGSPRRGIYFVGPDEAHPDKPVQVWTQGQDEDSRYWFPCFDAPHEKATSEVIATVPAHFTVVSNGTLLADMVDEDAGRRTAHWRFDTPHACYLISLVAAELSEIRARWGEVDVLYYVTPGREEDARRTVGRTPEMLELLSRLFRVPYPYEKYAQVFVADFIFGGMENTTATTLTDVVLLDERATVDRDAEDLVVHELAHQWFGDLLTCRDWSQGWLNEGFATYAEYLWRDHAHGRDEAAMELRDWAQSYFDEDATRYRRKVVTNTFDQPIEIFDRHLYQKGGLILHMLRQVLGDEPFWRTIAHYLARHRAGSVETRDLARAVEAASGRVLDWFFDQWITEGAGHPELEVRYAWDAERSLARVSVRQTQEVDATTPLFRLPVAMRFRVADSDVDVRFEVTEKQETFFFTLADEPTQAIFDPGKDLLARVDFDKGLDLLVAELDQATWAIDRVDAAERLARRGGRQATEALVRGLASDPFWGVRATCAGGLGEIRTAQAREVLIEAISATPHAKARRAVCRALGAFRGDERAAEALIGVIESGDPSYFVEAEACLALGKTRSPQAPAVLRSAAERASFMDVIRQNAYRGLAEARDDSAIPLLTEVAMHGRHARGRYAALGALAQLVKGRRDRDARDVRELAEHLLGDRELRVQIGAIDALAVIGDPAAVGAIEALAARELDGQVRRRTRDAARDLREGTRQSEDHRALRGEVERLRTTVAEMRERIDALTAQVELPSAKPAKKDKKKKRKK